MTAFFCEHESAEQSGDAQAVGTSHPTAQAFIEQDGVGADFQGEGESLRFAEVEVCSGEGGGDCQRCARFQPCGQCGMFPEEFGANRRRNDTIS